MNQIKIFYDKEENKEVGEEIIFEPSVAGTTETKSLFIQNLVNYPVDVEIAITGDIEKKVSERIESNGRIVLNLEVNSLKNATKPIIAEMEIKTRCLIG